MDNEFYITLASNLHTIEYPNNSINYFVTPLPSPLQLDTNEWQVGLAEIILPDTWYNITDTDNKITINVHQQEHTFNITNGYYSPKQLIKEIQSKIDSTLLKYINTTSNTTPTSNRSTSNTRTNTNPTHTSATRANTNPTTSATRATTNPSSTVTTKQCDITYDVESQKITIICKNTELLLNKHLSTKLGFIEKKIPKLTFSDGKHIAQSVCDLDYNCHIIFVYSNIVSETMLGNTFVKLLRTISTPSTLKFYDKQPIQYTTLTFDKPHYKKVSTSFENKIDIALVNSNGDPFIFESGEAHVVLHFKKDKKND